MKIINLTIPEYVFADNNNPYAFDNDSPKSIEPIAAQIEKSLVDNFETDQILVRGIQSGHHDKAKAHLIELIINNGSDIYGDIAADEVGVIHAAPYSPEIIANILGGFHINKPKCEERPQYPVDIWMVFDKNVYDNIEYMHPRHHVIARDKWQLKPEQNGLMGLMLININ